MLKNRNGGDTAMALKRKTIAELLWFSWFSTSKNDEFERCAQSAACASKNCDGEHAESPPCDARFTPESIA